MTWELGADVVGEAVTVTPLLTGSRITSAEKVAPRGEQRPRGATKSLPTFFPGHVAHLNGRHTTRGLAGIITGAVLLIIAVITAQADRRSSR